MMRFDGSNRPGRVILLEQVVFARISDQYRGQTAIVVGTGGIGLAIAELLSHSVAHLVVGDLSTATLHGVAVTGPAKVHRLPVNVTDVQSVAGFFEQAVAAAGPPRFLFQTAGILTLQSWASMSVADWDRAVDVNLNGTYYCVRHAADLMVPRKAGSILVVGSIAGTKARSGARVNPVYNATKAALGAFVNATAMQLRDHGVRINCIAPGPTATPMMDLQPAPVHEAIAGITLDRRQNLPAEVAELALFVAGHGRFTGEEVALGGGAGLGG